MHSQIDSKLIFDRALGFYQSGNLAEAGRLCSQSIEAEPKNPAILHLLGVIRACEGQNEEACELFDRALEISPHVTNILSDYGKVLEALGRPQDAIKSYDKALAIDPGHPDALCNRADILRLLRRFDEALANYDKLLTINPNAITVWTNRGKVLRQLRRPEEAIASYDKALVIDAHHAEALNNRGIVLSDLKRFEEALASFDRALIARPAFSEALYNRGIVLSELKRFEEALASYDKVLETNPGYTEAMCNRAVTLSELKRFDDALAAYDKILAIRPDFARVLSNRGNTLTLLGRFEEALASYDKALAINPDRADTLYNRGAALLELKQLSEAMASYERALAVDPGHPYALGGVAYAALNLCDWPRMGKIIEEIRVKVDQGAPVIAPFTLLGYSSDAELLLRCAKNYLKDKVPVPSQPVWSGTRYRHSRIRVAYLSADFREHATAFLLAELLERHSRSRFEIIGISFGPDDGSEIRSRLIKSFDQFHQVEFISDHEVAGLLRRLEIDIAVDLKGHTQGSRPGILAYRPAPVQVSYLGYPGSMGARFMDYIIADGIVAPFDRQPFFTEKIVHLPDCYQVNDFKRPISEDAPARREAGLPDEGFVFCCFNNSWKISAAVFEIWMRLLRAVPGSVLWLIDDNSDTCARLRSEAAARGIDSQRIVFARRAKLHEHLARHRLADLFLDTFPYNAHTTASDALWVGLPLVTCLGEFFPGRVAASLLDAIGLSELVTKDIQEYEDLALRLALDPPSLQSIRQKLEQNRNTYPLFDTERFRRNMEAAYTRMWEIAERGEKPESFSVGLWRT